MAWDWDTAKQVGSGAVVVIGGLIGTLYRSQQARFSKLEAAVALKADDAELIRQRNNIVELFREHAKIREDMNGGFGALREEMHTIHLDIVDRIGKLHG
jgi:hypothetical protein